MSVISFSWSHHLSRLTTKIFIKGKGWKIVPPSLRNTYQNINSNSFSHGWAKPTSTRELTASRNVFKASFPCFLPASLHIKELIYIIAPLRPFINFSSSAELCQHDAAAHGTVRHMSTKDNVDALEDAPQSRSDCGIQHLTRQHYSKIWGVSRKKLGVRKINKQRGGYVARTTILSAFPALLHLEFWIGEEHLQPADNWSEVAEHADTIHWFEGLYAACVRQPTFFWKNHPVYLALKWSTSFINKPDTILIWESLALFSRH